MVRLPLAVTGGGRGRIDRSQIGVVCWLASAVLFGCGSLAPSLSIDRSATLPRVAAGEEAWRIPRAALGSQRLFRLRYDGPDGEVGLRLTLRLAAANRYRLSANDLLGRAVWSLAVETEEGLWLDHRNHEYCRFTGAIELDALPLSPFRFTALPTLLLRRLPEPPARWIEPGAEYLDAEGKRWSYRSVDGKVVQWMVRQGGEPLAWWNGEGKESILSQRRGSARAGVESNLQGGLQIRWREVVRERMAILPPPPVIPEGYRVSCASESG